MIARTGHGDWVWGIFGLEMGSKSYVSMNSLQHRPVVLPINKMPLSFTTISLFPFVHLLFDQNFHKYIFLPSVLSRPQIPSFLFLPPAPPTPIPGSWAPLLLSTCIPEPGCRYSRRASSAAQQGGPELPSRSSSADTSWLL